MTTVQAPDTTAMASEGTALVAQAQAVKIVDHPGYEAAGALLVSVATLRKTIETAFKDPKAKAHEAHKAITELEKKMLKAPSEAETILKTEMARFQRADAERRAKEAAAAQEAIRKQEEDRRLAEAVQLEAAGMPEMAEAVISAPIQPAAVSIPKPTAAGISTVTVWTFRIVDVAALPREYLIPDETKIRQVVAAMKADTKIQGVVVEPRQEIRTRTTTRR